MTPARRSFTQVDNKILERMHEVGIAPVGVLIQLLRHRNRRTGQCNPSYATLARETGLHRDTVIRHIKRLEVLGWVIKRASWAQEGDQSSNWYEFPDWILGDRPEPPGSRIMRPPQTKNTVSHDQGSRTIRPETEENNQKERTKDAFTAKEEKEVAISGNGFTLADTAMATASQRACTHRRSKLQFDDVIVCGSCYGKLVLALPTSRDIHPPESDIRPSGEIH